MMKFFAGCFEAVCNILAVLNFLIWTAGGAVGGYLLADSFFYDRTVLCTVLLAVAGLAVAFVINIFSFGFIAQIIQIRKSLEKKQ